jgi:hypothetical protein
MEIEVTFLTRKGRDAVLRKSQRVTLPGNAAGFGRGADKEVQLTDIRVNLAAADLEIHDDHLTIRARPETELQINGSPTIGGAVNVGDKISIGPYDVVIEAPPEGAAAAVTVELVKSSGDTHHVVVVLRDRGGAVPGPADRRVVLGRQAADGPAGTEHDGAHRGEHVVERR